jgi:hypothetical protein
MISPDEIRQKAERKYLDFLRAFLRDEAFFPLEFPVGALPKDYPRLSAAILKLRDSEKLGYRLELETSRTRQFGEQHLPKRIYIEDASNFLKLIKRQGEFQAFERDIRLIRSQLPQLENWLIQNPQQVLNYLGEWDSLCAVCGYFMAHLRPNRYLRELPIEVHTKFIEQHMGILRLLFDFLLPTESIAEEKDFYLRYGLRYAEPLIRLRFLDKGLQNSPYNDISIPVSELARHSIPAQNCLIVENQMTFLSLPALPKTLAIWGGGFMLGILREIQWLNDMKIYYWGDLDAQGFEMLSRLRTIFPQTKSILMDEYTLQQFADYIHAGTEAKALSLNLSLAEQQVYEYLQSRNERLEQEQLSHAFVLKRLQALIDDF